MIFLNIFSNNILPILILSGAGFVLGKILKIDSRPVGQVIFYILSPVLVFNLLITDDLPLSRIGTMMGFTAAGTLSIALIAFLVGKALRLERRTLIVVVLTSMSVNSGNFGLPLVSFAFGESALAYASIYFVTSTMIFYTIGVTIASLGHLKLKQALFGLLKVPAIYAGVLAVVFVQTGWVLPEMVNRTLTLAAGGAIPAMLILLGLELQKVEWSRKMGAISIPVFIRLCIGPLMGLFMSSLFRLPVSAQHAGVSEMSGPTAVMTTVLATEYKLDSSLVTVIVFATTVISPITLTVVLYFLTR
jgi:predicted permease